MSIKCPITKKVVSFPEWHLVEILESDQCADLYFVQYSPKIAKEESGEFLTRCFKRVKSYRK